MIAAADLPGEALGSMVWLLVGLMVLLLFGRRLFAWVRRLLRLVLLPIVLLLAAAWLIASGEAERIINHIG